LSGRILFVMVKSSEYPIEFVNLEIKDAVLKSSDRFSFDIWAPTAQVRGTIIVLSYPITSTGKDLDRKIKFLTVVK
jgi:hypothetical protein